MPYGREEMDEKVFHFFKSAVLPDPPPFKPLDLPQPPAEFDMKPWTMKLLCALFPDAANQHAIHDLCPKKKKHWKEDRGGKKVRVPADTLVKEDGLFEQYKAHMIRCAELHDADTFFVYGPVNHRIFTEAFGQGLEDKQGMYTDIGIGHKLVSLAPPLERLSTPVDWP